MKKKTEFPRLCAEVFGFDTQVSESAKISVETSLDSVTIAVRDGNYGANIEMPLEFAKTWVVKVNDLLYDPRTFTTD